MKSAATVLLSGRIQCDKNGQVIQLDKDTVPGLILFETGSSIFLTKVGSSRRHDTEYSNPDLA